MRKKKKQTNFPSGASCSVSHVRCAQLGRHLTRAAGSDKAGTLHLRILYSPKNKRRVAAPRVVKDLMQAEHEETKQRLVQLVRRITKVFSAAFRHPPFPFAPHFRFATDELRLLSVLR
eukprot:1717721-Rhodomonas_salina.4